MPYTFDFVLVDKARMNEKNSGNNHVVAVTQLLFLIFSVELYVSSGTTACDIP